MGNAGSGFWMEPYPEALKRLFSKVSGPVISKFQSKKIDDSDFRQRCVIVTAVMFVLLLIFTGTWNPLELMIDIPLFSIEDFLNTLPVHENVGALYFVCSTAYIAIGISLLKLFVFNNQEYSFLSINGLCYWIMTLFVSAICDTLAQKTIYMVAINMSAHISLTWFLFIAAVGIAASCTLYFMLSDALSTTLSIALAPIFIQLPIFSMISISLLKYLCVTAILKVLLTFIDKIGLWNGIVQFIKKWCYTPKYIAKVVFFYFYIAIILLALMGLGTEKREN